MSSKDYRIAPPPNDSGDEPLFRVVYAIDVNASDEQKAAESAWQMMRAKDALDPVLMVLDSKGKQVELDLSEYLEFNKVTTGFVIQKFRRDDKGIFKCIDQEFITGDDVQFENLKGDKIEVPDHEYQSFNMILPNTGEIINRLNDALAGINVGGEQSRQFANEIDMLNEVLKAMGYSASQSKAAKLGLLESQLLEACRVITSYVMDLLYRLDDQVNLSNIEELQRARDVIDRYDHMAAQSGS